MIPEFLRGVIVPLFTPCNADGSIDPVGVKEFVRYINDRGSISSIFARSGMGRMYTFSVADTKLMTDLVVEAAGDTPVLPGTSGEWDRDRDNKPDPERYTAQTIELSRYAAQKGAAAVVIVMPEALKKQPGKPVGETIIEYFQKVAPNVEVPIVIYNPPGISAEYEIRPEILVELQKMPNIAGMKYSTADLDKLKGISDVKSDEFAFIAGNETAFLDALKLDAVGVIGQGCDINPEILKAVHDYYVQGNHEEAAKAQDAANKCLEACEGIDSVLFLLRHAAEQGYNVQPYTRRGQTGYEGREEQAATISDADYERLKTAIDKLAGPYRAAR